MRAGLSGTAYALGWAVTKRLPAGVVRAAADLAARVLVRRNGTGVRRLAANLARVLPPEADSGAVLREGMRSYLRYWSEVFRLPVMDPQDVAARTRTEGADRLRAAYDSGRGVVLALPHMGNWDAAAVWALTSGMRFTTVAERLQPESLFRRFVAFREGLGMEVVPLTGGEQPPYALLRRRLEAGGMLCLLADRDLSTSGVAVDFFGARARMPAGPAALAHDTGAALIPVTLWFRPDGWALRFHPEVDVPAAGSRADRVRAATQALADVFAGGIAEHPEDWHMLQRVWADDRVAVT